MDPLTRRADRRDLATVVLVLLLVGFLLFVARQQGEQRTASPPDVTLSVQATRATGSALAQPDATALPATPTAAPSPAIETSAAVASTAVRPAAAVSAATATPIPATATALPPSVTATAAPATATPAPPPTPPPTAAPVRPAPVPARTVPTATRPPVRAARLAPTRTPSPLLRATVTARTSALADAGTAAAPTATKIASKVEAVQVARSSLAPGNSQALVVVAPPGTALTATITYPSHQVSTYRGVAASDGVFRVLFSVPATAGSGLAQVRVTTPGAVGSVSFAVS